MVTSIDRYEEVEVSVGLDVDNAAAVPGVRLLPLDQYEQIAASGG